MTARSASATSRRVNEAVAGEAAFMGARRRGSGPAGDDDAPRLRPPLDVVEREGVGALLGQERVVHALGVVVGREREALSRREPAVRTHDGLEPVLRGDGPDVQHLGGRGGRRHAATGASFEIRTRHTSGPCSTYSQPTSPERVYSNW